MLLALSTIFLEQHYQPMSSFTYLTIIGPLIEIMSYLANQQLCWAIANMLRYTNNCVNFHMYFLSGSRFGKEATQLFCVCRRKGQNAPGVLATVTRSNGFTDMTVMLTQHMHTRMIHKIHNERFTTQIEYCPRCLLDPRSC